MVDSAAQAYGRLKNDMTHLASTTGHTIHTTVTQQSNSICAGVIAFGGANALSCWIQGSFLGISTGSVRPIPTICGMATVTVASFIAHSAAICSNRYCTERQKRKKSISDAIKVAWSHRPSLIDQRIPNDTGVFWTNGPNNPFLHTIRVCVVGLLCFKLLGGRYWSVAPSSYTHVGSYARGSIVATDQYATPVQRLAVQRLGRRFGCHTCGRKPLPFLPSKITFIGDHQPPKSVAYQLNQQWFRRLLGRKIPFRFYPHCVTCSNKQGGILASATFDLARAKSWSQWWNSMTTGSLKRLHIPSLRAAGGGTNAYVHGMQPRLYHLTGGIVAALATGDQDQGRKQYEKMQSHVTAAFGRPYQTAAKYIQRFYENRIPQRIRNY